MGEQRSAPNGTATATPGTATANRPHPAGSSRRARSIRVGAAGFLAAACTVATLTGCGNPASGPSVAVPGGAELTVGAPEHSPVDAGDDGSQDMAAGMAPSEDDAAVEAPADPSTSETTPSASERIRARATHTTTPRATGRTPTRRATTTSPAASPARRTVTSSAATRSKTTTTHPTASSGGTVLAGGKATPVTALTLGPGAPTADESEVTRLVNVERVVAGCSALSTQPLLTQVARAHSQTMTAADGFKHNSPDGRTPFQRLTAVGYEYVIAGENIAAGQPTPAAVVQAWMNSPEHKANMLDCRFTQIGVGKAYVVGSQYGTYWTQDLATPM